MILLLFFMIFFLYSAGSHFMYENDEFEQIIAYFLCRTIYNTGRECSV